MPQLKLPQVITMGKQHHNTKSKQAPGKKGRAQKCKSKDKVNDSKKDQAKLCASKAREKKGDTDESPEAKKARSSKSVPMDKDREAMNWGFADEEMDFKEMKIELNYDEDDVLPPKRRTMGKNPYAILEDEEEDDTKKNDDYDGYEDNDDDDGKDEEIFITEVKKSDIRDNKSETDDEVKVIEKDTHDHEEDDDKEDEDDEAVEMMKDAKAPGQQQGTLDAFFHIPLMGPDTPKCKNKHQPQNTKPSQSVKDSTTTKTTTTTRPPGPDSKESQHGPRTRL